LCIVGCRDVQQSPETDTVEQADTQKRKELLLALLGIIEEKKKNNDEVVNADATDHSVVNDDTLSTSSPGKQRICKASSEKTFPTPSSGAFRRNHESKQKVKSAVEERDFRDKVNLSSPNESRLESDRHSSSSSNSKQRKHASEDAVKKPLPTASKHRLQPQMSEDVERKFSVNDRSLLGPCPSTASKSEYGVRCLEAIAGSDAEQHSRKMGVVSECKTERSRDKLMSKPNDQQLLAQEPENNIVVFQTDVNEPFLVMAAEREHLSDVEDAFEFSPPRKVRLKFRGGTSGTCGDSTELSALSTTDTPSSPANTRSSCLPSPNCKEHKQLSEDAAENHRCRKPALLSHSPASSKRHLQPLISHSPKSCDKQCDKQHKQPSQDAAENDRCSKPPLLGHPPSASRRHSQPLVSRKRKCLADRSVCYESSASENERVVKKSLQHGGAQARLYTRPERNDQSHCRGLTTHPHSSAKRFHGGTLKQVEERIQRLKKSNDVVQEQHPPRFERESGFKTEPLWKQSPEEVSWQEGDGATWLEENTRIKREYHTRYDESFQEERVTDLRQKLDVRRRQCINRHYRDEEAHRPVLFDDQPVNHFDDERQCLLRAPRQPQCDDSSREYDSYYNSQRHHCSSLLGGFTRPRQDVFLQDDDSDSWMNMNHRQSREYSRSSLDEEPHLIWHREVGLYSPFRV